MPRLTVIMPARNAEKTILTALNSCLRSMPRDSELVVWDDGSTDGTRAVVQAHPDPRVRSFLSEIGVGGGQARIELLDATDSEFVACMDADDIAVPGRFYRQVQRLRDDVDFVFGSTVRFSESPMRIRPTLTPGLNAPEVRASMLVGNFLPHPAMFGRRAAITAVGGYRALERGQDYDLWLRALTGDKRIVLDARPAVFYRVSAGQVSRAPEYIATVKNDASLQASYAAFVEHSFPRVSSTLSDYRAGATSAGAYENAVVGALGVARPRARRYLTRRISRTGTYATFRGEP